MPTELEQALKLAQTTGEVSTARLKELADAEANTLGNIAMDRQRAGDYTNIDLLDGDTNILKARNFTDRTTILRQVGDYLDERKAADMVAEQFARDQQLKAAQNAAGDTGARFQQAEQQIDRATAAAHGIVVWDDNRPAQSVFKSMVPELGMHPSKVALHGVKNRGMTAAIDPMDFIGELKAVSVTTVMPIDRFGRIYPMRTDLLDYLSIEAAPGQQIFYQEPPPPVESTPANGPRNIGDLLQDENIPFVNRRLDKRSMGRRTRINIEDAAAHPAVLDRAGRQLMVLQRRLMVAHILNGDNDNAGSNQWWGLIPHFNTTTGDGTNTNAVPNAASPANEWIEYMETTALRLWERGTPPDVIVMTHANWAAFRRGQRAQRYQQPDYTQFPYGEFAGIPLLPTNLMPANTLVMLNTNPFNLYVELQSDSMVVEMSDEVGFDNNQLSMRIVTYGNVALVAPASGYKLTATNNLNVVMVG